MPRNDTAFTVEDLSDMYASGKLTQKILHLAVNHATRGRADGEPYSTGVRWICKNPGLFTSLLNHSGNNAKVFFRNHLAGGYVHEVLYSEPILRSVPAWWRTDFVRDILLSGRPVGHGWLPAALKADIPVHMLAEMILEKLRVEPVDIRSKKVTFTEHKFLREGSGPVFQSGGDFPEFTDQPTYWSMLTNSQLKEAMQICAVKAPALLLSDTASPERYGSLVGKLGLRLYSEDINQLLEMAAENLTSLERVTASGLSGLSVSSLRNLVERFQGGSPSLVILLAQRLGYEGEGLGILNWYSDLLTESSVEDIHTAVHDHYMFMLDWDEYDLSDCVLDMLDKALAGHGWAIGTVKVGNYKGRTQKEVMLGGTVYVQSHRFTSGTGSHYVPRVGDRVLIDLNAGRDLTPQVKVVDMVPIRQPFVR